MKKLAIMQPYIFPYIGYFQLVNAVDKFVFYDDVDFIKQGWINRNYLLVNDNPSLFSIPVKNISSNQKIKDVEIVENKKWKKTFLRTIFYSYKKAPFFDAIYNLVESITDSGENKIGMLAISSIRKVASYLNINTEFSISAGRYENDSLTGEARVLDICQQENATHYINPIGGRSLYSKELFSRHGIELSFIKTGDVTYEQFGNTFVPSLSIIDVMMFNLPEQIRDFLNDFEFI